MSQKQIKRIRRVGREATKSVMGVHKEMEAIVKENQLLKKRLGKYFDDAHMEALKAANERIAQLEKTQATEWELGKRHEDAMSPEQRADAERAHMEGH